MQEWLEGAHADELTAFCAVAQFGSFARASKALERDASLLSRRVSALERRLGIRLFERTTRRVTLTEPGVALNIRVREILASLGDAEHQAAALSSEPQGRLRLALPATFGRLWIAPVLPEFLASYPKIVVEAEFSDRYSDLVADRFDAAVRIGSIPDSSLVTRRLAPHRRILCASPEYLDKTGSPSDATELEAHACLGFSGLATYPDWRLSRDGRTIVLRPSGPLIANDSEALIASAVAGLGIMLCADWLVGHEISAGRLVHILTDWSFEDDGAIQALLPSSRHVPAKARVFLDWIVARMTPVPPWSR